MIQMYEVHRAHQLARIAMRRGDIDAAERWFRLADRAASIVQRLQAIDGKTPKINPL